MILGLIVFSYFLLLVSLYYGFSRIKECNEVFSEHLTSFSIIIPFRNEEDNLLQLLHSIQNLSYSNEAFEIIMVDDFSTDNSKKIIQTFCKKNKLDNLKIIPNIESTRSPKKTAISQGVMYSKHDWIITTDADCILPNNWLNSYNHCISINASDFIYGPVAYKAYPSFLNKFQILDLLSLQITTIGAQGLNIPFLCNGANMAYNKKAFKKLNGFDGNLNLSSGDDTFTLKKFSDSLYKISYLKNKNALVCTSAQKTIKGFINQRLRWASKSNHYNFFGKLTGLIVLSINIYLLLLFISLSINRDFAFSLLLTFTLKVLLDLVFLIKGNRFFNYKIGLKDIFISSVIYPFYIILITLLTPFMKFEWKGRVYKK